MKTVPAFLLNYIVTVVQTIQGEKKMDWKNELSKNVTTVEELKKVLHWDLTKVDTEKLKLIIKQYPMSITRYYLSLIDPSNENDPIRKLCIPSIKETDLSGSSDTSGETENTVINGLQHKYKKTGLILSTNQCAMYCRHCFRKRLVGLSDKEISKQFKEVITYIQEHKEINNVLISGGDALLISNHKIKDYLEQLVTIDHIEFIRFGTRTPVVLPLRIYGDSELKNILKEYSRIKKIYIVTHFNHPRELTEESRKAIDCLLDMGIILKNQTVLLKGINDDPMVMAKLINKLTKCGVVPYYIFQCRPVSGIKNQFQLPLMKGYKILQETKEKLNGQGKCFRYVLSNETGKIEILGNLSEDTMLFKYHQAKYEKDQGRIFTLNLSDNQCWI